jgi:hypothetical protein
MATHPFPGGSVFTDEDEDAFNKVAMVSRNTTNKTPAQITAIVVWGQFLKVCSMMLSARLAERLTLSLASSAASGTASAFFVDGVGNSLYELENIGLGKCWRCARHPLPFREPSMAPSNDASATSCLACHLGPGPRM